MDTLQNAIPALGLLLLLILLAWGVRKFRHHLAPGGAQGAQMLRTVSTLALGPQHRVVLLEITEPGSEKRHWITVGVTAHSITALHNITPSGDVTPLSASAQPPLPPAFQAQLESQLRTERHDA